MTIVVFLGFFLKSKDFIGKNRIKLFKGFKIGSVSFLEKIYNDYLNNVPRDGYLLKTLPLPQWKCLGYRLNPKSESMKTEV